jgi:cell division protein ZapA (FtsZ GTPase activity inhibitor)
MSTRRTISLHGIRIPLKTEASEADLDQAIALVRDRMGMLAEQSSVKEPARLAAMAALNLAGELILAGRREDDLQAEGLRLLSERIATHLEQQEELPD